MDVGTARRGVRNYIAFSGGIRVPHVLGSMSADLLSGLGPSRLTTGDVLQLNAPGNDPAGQVACSMASVPAAPLPSRQTELLAPAATGCPQLGLRHCGKARGRYRPTATGSLCDSQGYPWSADQASWRVRVS